MSIKSISFLLIAISATLSACSLYDEIKVPGYLAVGLTLAFVIFIGIWFVRRIRRRK